MTCYFDSAYIMKCYVNEPDAPAVRQVMKRASALCSSAWCLAEVGCAFHRHVLEASLTVKQAAQLLEVFLSDVRDGIWTLYPVGEQLLSRVGALAAQMPAAFPIRAGDALHLATAQQQGFSEIWSNDRRLLAAAPHFRLVGRSV